MLRYPTISFSGNLRPSRLLQVAVINTSNLGSTVGVLRTDGRAASRRCSKQHEHSGVFHKAPGSEQWPIVMWPSHSMRTLRETS